MAEHTLTRRGILGAMALAPMAITTPAVAASSDLSAALAEHAKAERAEKHFDRTVYVPADDRFETMSAAVPHATVQWVPNPHFAGETWSTADMQKVANARYFLHHPGHKKPIDAGMADYHVACLALLAAVEKREDAIAHAKQVCRIDELRDESERLQDVTRLARDAVINCPVSTAQDLATKITFITDHGQREYDETREMIAADVRRLAQG